MSNLNYRRDNRSVEQFANDIKNSTSIEQSLMTLYVKHLNKISKGKDVWSFVDTGVDNTGKLIKDDKRVSTEADFELFKNQVSQGKFDVKFSRKKVRNLHLKEQQLISYLKQNAKIILFMDVERPEYILLEMNDIQKLIQDGKRVWFWSKWCRKINCKDYTWTLIQ